MEPPLLSQTVSRFTESVIRGMSIEAARYKAVNLAQGMPDFPAPPEVKDAAWTPKRRRFSVLLTRFRWEDAAAARRPLLRLPTGAACPGRRCAPSSASPSSGGCRRRSR